MVPLFGWFDNRNKGLQDKLSFIAYFCHVEIFWTVVANIAKEESIQHDEQKLFPML